MIGLNFFATFESEMNLDFDDNLHVTNQPNLILDFVLPNFVSQEKSQAPEEEITTYEIPYYPTTSLPNEFFLLLII